MHSVSVSRQDATLCPSSVDWTVHVYCTIHSAGFKKPSVQFHLFLFFPPSYHLHLSLCKRSSDQKAKTKPISRLSTNDSQIYDLISLHSSSDICNLHRQTVGKAPERWYFLALLYVLSLHRNNRLVNGPEAHLLCTGHEREQQLCRHSSPVVVQVEAAEEQVGSQACKQKPRPYETLRKI